MSTTDVLVIVAFLLVLLWLRRMILDARERRRTSRLGDAHSSPRVERSGRGFERQSTATQNISTQRQGTAASLDSSPSPPGGSGAADHPLQPPSGPQPRIVTRTGPRSGIELEDEFAMYGERAFTRAEDEALLRHYASGMKVFDIAGEMQVDAKQVASRLARLLLAADGRLDTDDDSPRARRRYEAWELERMHQAYGAGLPLRQIADDLGRSQLGVGWRMLDLRIPSVPEGPAR